MRACLLTILCVFQKMVHVCDLERFFGRFTTFDLNLAPKKVFLGAHDQFFGPSCYGKGNRARF